MSSLRTWVEYAPGDGQIVSCAILQDDVLGEAKAAAQRNGNALLEVEAFVDLDLWYIHKGKPHTRPKQNTTLIGTTLCEVPVPATIHVEGEAYQTDDSVVELDFEFPGTYEVRVESFPYLDKTVEVVVP